MTTKRKRVVIVGQGYVGLPLALAASAAGCVVIGIDSDADRVRQLNEGSSPTTDVSDAQLKSAIADQSYSANTSFADVGTAEVVVLCVPTPYRNQAPDLSYITKAAQSVGSSMSPGVLIILESTTYPGTTEEVLMPILEQSSGLRHGIEFDLAFSPERIDPGNPIFGVHNTPKIVGGITAAATQRACEFYSLFVDRVVAVSSTSAAEMTKLLENTFRHINIALVNELAILCREMGIDVWEVINAAASKPFGFMPFYPGPGVGGHCIPVDPMYLSWRVKQFGGSAKFIDLAREINESMPLYCVARVQDLLNDLGLPMKGSRILVIGVAYKPNVSDVRESPALMVIANLMTKFCNVSYLDPLVPNLTLPTGQMLQSVAENAIGTGTYDCAIIVTPHDCIDYPTVCNSSSVVFDTRNYLKAGTPKVVRL